MSKRKKKLDHVLSKKLPLFFDQKVKSGPDMTYLQTLKIQAEQKVNK